MAEEKRKNYKREPSDYMVNAFVRGGSLVVECYCGRTHFTEHPSSVNFYNDGELSDLYELKKQNPDKYVVVGDSDSVRHCLVNGEVYVDGCPCNRLACYEDFIWAHKEEIARYLKDRATAEFNAAKLAHALTGEAYCAVTWRIE